VIIAGLSTSGRSGEMRRAIQVTTGSRRAKRVNKPMVGHFAKAEVPAGRGVWEFRLLAEEATDLTVKQELGVEMFSAGQKVDVSGISIGKGFAGTIKRHGFTMGDATHGNSLSHRAPGSIGQNQSPGRVFKGKKMSGHMGNVKRTTQSLEIVRVDKDRQLLLVKGAIPGSKGGDVIIHPAVKVGK
jgi:large subunit ribosomal protein L3